MGSYSSKEIVEVAAQPQHQGVSSELRRMRHKEQEIDVDVIEVSNIALAIKHKQHIVNVEVTINARSLPPPKAFEERNIMVALFKIDAGEAVEQGRTQIISDDLNPKFLNSFIVPSSTDRQEDVQFRIYNFVNPKSGLLEQQTLLGTAQQSLNALLDNEISELPVILSDTAHKEKTMLRVGCTEYDGGNHKYEVVLEASNFTGKMDMYFVLMVLRDGEWVPVARSLTAEVKKKAQFKPLKVAAYKFPGEETTRLRFRFYDQSREQEEVGQTEDITLFTLLQQERGLVEKVYNKSGFVAGSVTVVQWLKVTRNSFLTYIVNGARLHLILGIDYTNSNFQGQPLHHPVDDKNEYIAAIREIVGMLQYFDYYNQIALYGFGGKLPPYYSCMGQCFALNGNYFNPLITGGVDQIINLYKHNLQQIKPHGPSQLAPLIKVAIQFAQSDYQSTNYYVLVVLTDGAIDDYTQTVESIIEAASLPLSIVLVGLGDGDFSQLEKIDMDEGDKLISESTGKVCERDMIDFIHFKEYLHEEQSPLKETSLARKTFSEIPTQYVDYMQSKKIDPNREKKGPKAAKADFINEKIKEFKNSPIIPETDFLKDQRRRMKKELIQLGFQDDEALERALVLPINDLNYFIELYSSQQPRPPPPEWRLAETVACRQQKRFEEHLQRNEQRKDRRIQKELLKRQVNQLGRKVRVAEPVAEQAWRERPQLQHPCLRCGQREICMLMMGCGHLAVCEECVTPICILCRENNPEYINISSISL